MALRLVFNPISGTLDYVNDSVAPPVTDKYVDTFNATTDWTLNVDVYEITVLAATHGKGADAQIEVFEFTGGNYEKTNVSSIVNGSNDVIISVASSPDLRFMGKLIIT
jgi:hypothetical protein